MEISFNGKRVLVTGATQGIGREIAIQLYKCGAQVIAVGRSVINLESLKDEYPSIETIHIDLADWNATKEALRDVSPIDLLVNNAGVSVTKPLNLLNKDDFDRVFDINVKAVFNVTQIVIDDLIKRKVPGSIVNISSQASTVGLTNHAAYCASKAAVDAFTRVAAIEFGPHNIRVNCVNPTVVLTEMGKMAWSDPAVANPMLEKIPLRRFCTEREVADSVLFLLSDKAAMITGTCLPVDGGYIAG